MLAETGKKTQLQNGYELMQVINSKLLLHPVNWGIVWVYLLIVGSAWVFIHDRFSHHSSDAQ